MHGLAAVFVIFFSLIINGCGGGGGDPAPQPVPPPPAPMPDISLATRFLIDGMADFTMFDQTSKRSVQLLDNFGSGAPVATINVEWGVLNDDRDLYLAIRWDDSTQNNTYEFVQGSVDFDGLRLILDSDLSGTVNDNDDIRVLVAAGSSSQYIDQYRSGTSDVDDAVGDGRGRLRYDVENAQYTA